MPEPSALLVRAFTILCVLTAAVLPLGAYLSSIRLGSPPGTARRRSLRTLAGVAAWMTVTFVAAASGALAFGPLPPPITYVLVPMVLGAFILARSKLGERLATGVPLAALVGVQAFRLPLELIMHRAYAEGVMPVQMSYAGYNFDILTGASAVIVAVMIAANRMPLWGVRVWNWVGSLLLLNIVVIALLSTPTPIRVFQTEPANVWIAQAPFVWLPAVMVFYAFLGHMLVYRRLRLEYAAASPDRVIPGPASSTPFERA